MTDYPREIMGEFKPNKELYDFAMEYHERCDSYDVYRCGNSRGLPMDHYARRDIYKNAISVRRELEDRAIAKGISIEDLGNEIRRLAR